MVRRSLNKIVFIKNLLLIHIFFVSNVLYNYSLNITSFRWSFERFSEKFSIFEAEKLFSKNLGYLVGISWNFFLINFTTDWLVKTRRHLKYISNDFTILGEKGKVQHILKNNEFFGRRVQKKIFFWSENPSNIFFFLKSTILCFVIFLKKVWMFAQKVIEENP